MKSIRRVSIILIIAFLLTTPSVIAQDNDPPSILPEPSQNEPFFSEAPLSGSISPDNIKKSKNRATSASRTSSRGVTDVTDVLCLSCINDEAELNPEVAYGGGYYVVAYEEGGAVHANVFNRDGSIHLTVRDIHSNSGTPDVAYEATTGLFLIVWQLDYWDDGSDYDILSIALSPTSGLVGSTIAVSSDNNHERYPSVDCNPADSSCLVAYEYDFNSTTYIDGAFMDMSATMGVSRNDPNFHISTTTNDYGPIVAFGDQGYLVADTFFDVSAIAWPVYNHVYPTYQSVGNQYMHGTAYLVNPGDLTDANDKYPGGAAWDGCANKFAVTYTYDYYGNGSDLDVHVRGVDDNSATVYPIQWVAGTGDSEFTADISFIENYPWTSTSPYASKMIVAYVRSGGVYDEGIIATDLVSNCSSLSPSYDIPPEYQHFLVKEPNLAADSLVLTPAITGADGFKDFLIAWLDVQGGTPDELDIFGRLMDASEKNFLPLNNK